MADSHPPDYTTNPDLGVLYNPIPGAPIPPPWYRSPLKKGTPRLRTLIAGGYVIPVADGVDWFKRVHQYTLSDDHFEDLNVLPHLTQQLREGGLDVTVAFAERRDTTWSDFYVISQRKQGEWIHDGPDGVEEVLEEDRKLVPTEEDERIREILEKEHGKFCSSFSIIKD